MIYETSIKHSCTSSKLRDILYRL